MVLTSSTDPIAAIDRANLAESTKRQYKRALKRYFRATGASFTNVDALVSYAQTLPDSSRAFLKAAVRTVTEGLATSLKGQATPGNINQVQAALYCIEALQDAVKVKQSNGTKPNIWLTREEVKRLIDTCENGIVGQRDKVVLGLLVAAGLRRSEAANLRFEDVRQQPGQGPYPKSCTSLTCVLCEALARPEPLPPGGHTYRN
jgi:integrase